MTVQCCVSKYSKVLSHFKCNLNPSIFQCIVFTVGDEGFSTESNYDYVIFEDSNNGSGMFTNLINSKQNYTINLSLKRMPFTGADILYTHNIEAKQLILKLFSLMFLD